MKQQLQKLMNRTNRAVMALLTILCCCAVSVRVAAQAPQNPPSRQNPPTSGSTPDAINTKPKGTQPGNPFPEDTNTVPVLPSANSAGTPEPPPDAADYGSRIPLPGADSDPVRSPDDPASVNGDSGSSSSAEGIDNLLKPPPDTDSTGKHRKLSVPEETHQESAKEDESVGSYYLDQKNWKAALSRFESAVVLDPENPDVYWGLAEAQRHTGDYFNAKANYLKVTGYDPDSKHGKEAKRFLKDPELANAKAISTYAPASQSHP
jgi:tetratricopeptide (TPR) repeat protein